MRIIRRATVADIPSLFAIRVAVQENAAALIGLTDRGVTPASVAEMLSPPRLHYQIAAGWVAEDDSQVLGFAIARASRAEVFALFVSPDRQGQGIGTMLLREAEVWLFSQGIARAWLTTAPGTRAVQFYKHRQWQRGGQEEDGQIVFIKQLGRESRSSKLLRPVDRKP